MCFIPYGNRMKINNINLKKLLPAHPNNFIFPSKRSNELKYLLYVMYCYVLLDVLYDIAQLY